MTALTQSERPVILGQFGPPTLTCIRSWGRQGFAVGMVCIKAQEELAPRSRYLDQYTTLPLGLLQKTEGIHIVVDFLNSFRATGLICVNENIAQWLNDHREVIPSEVSLWIPSNTTINNLRSKKQQIKTARTVGFTLLPTYHVDDSSHSITSIPADQFPLCLRPDFPGTVRPPFKARVISDRDDLSTFVNSLKHLSAPIIAQPFRNLPNLVIHGARTIRGETIGLHGFLVDRKFEGVTLTIRPIELDRQLFTQCADFTAEFDVTGNYHFEFLYNEKDKSATFLELNCRFGGTTAKVYACGYDEPLYALKSYGVPVRPNRKVKNVVVSSRRALLKYLYYTLRGKLTSLDYPEEPTLRRISQTLYAFITSRDDVFSLRDLSGSLGMYLDSLKLKLPW